HKTWTLVSLPRPGRQALGSITHRCIPCPHIVMADCLGQIKDEQSFTGLLFEPKVLGFILCFLLR
ncbi:hypothetical protein, partial [Pseudomonas sp. Sample_9]|uniref:hypothetical protein n=1 Tax=Pseudomonas sp. Sample_9 TaxID=2382158 RepID=UPI0019D69F6D